MKPWPMLALLLMAGLATTACTTGRLRAVSGCIRDVPPESATEKERRHAAVAARRAGTMVIIHRGASDFAPENTLEAYAAAMDRGADGCEIDIRRSRDGVLYLHHDDELGRVFDGSGPVHGLTYFELLQHRPVRVHGAARSDARIPTLVALLTLARQRAMLLHLDIKEPGLDAAIAALLDASDTWDHIVHINVYNSQALRASPQLRLLGYKGWDHEAGQTAASRRAFLAKPAPMVFAGGDPAKALELVGREAPFRPIPLPDGLRIPWTQDGPAAGNR